MAKSWDKEVHCLDSPWSSASLFWHRWDATRASITLNPSSLVKICDSANPSWCLPLSDSRRRQSPEHRRQFTHINELYWVQHKEPPATTKSNPLRCTKSIHNFCVLKSCNCTITKTRFPPDSEHLSRILRKIQSFCYMLAFRCSEHQTCITHSDSNRNIFSFRYFQAMWISLV